MNHFYECTVKYDKTQENGVVKTTTEKYMVEAISFADAENRFIEEITPFVSGEYDINPIRRLIVGDIFESDDPEADRWFKSKLAFITIDEKTGIEKKSPQIVYVRAKDFDDARNTIQEGMKGTLADWEKSAIQETTIMDVIRINSEE